MAVRTTAAKVKQIIDTNLSYAIVEAHITGASLVIDEVLGSDTTISSELKEEIERWLSAHLIASGRELQIKEEGAGGAYIKYQGAHNGMGLESTMYGQQAMALDVTGKLRALSSSKQASMYAATSFDD